MLGEKGKEQPGRERGRTELKQARRPGQPGRRWTRIRALCCVGAGMILYGALTFLPSQDSPVTPEGGLRREGYGGDTRQVPLCVEGVWEEPVPVTVEVDARQYTEAEAAQAFTEIMDGMAERIRGENPSLMEVRTDLTLPTWLSEYGVRLRWSSSAPEILDSFGKLQGGDGTVAAPEVSQVYLGVRLTADSYHREYEIPVRVLPPEQTTEQAQLDGLLREIHSRDEAQKTAEMLILPDQYDGKTLRYRSGEESGYGVLLLLGVIMAALCYMKEQADAREQEKRRERELLLDYAELLSKLMVFTGAGMTVRGAWERLVTDYESAVLAGRQRRRAAYEEMGQTWHQLESGMPEGAAYREFGRRCKLQPYLKLSSLLEQNRRTGTKNLREILQMEMADAFEQRKNLARRLGEEAGTKLLLPLFLMLGIVMVMIMVPAMMTMG